jgi:hypothetical protein
MEPAIQQEPTGCAIASAAAIAGINYPQAKQMANKLGIHAQDQALWSDTGPIRKLLAALGYHCSDKETPFTQWNSLPDCALLAIKWHLQQGKPYWHWVVFVRDQGNPYVMDSNKALKHHKRTDFGRIKPKWFISVESN